MNRFERRLQSFRTKLQEKGCAGALLTPSGDMEYLLGVRRRRPNATKSHMHGDWLFGALITEQDCVFISPLLAHRFIEEQVEDKPWIDDVIMIAEGEPVNELARKLFDRYEFAGATVAVPREAMASTPVRLQELFPETTFQLTRDIVAPMRAVKDDYELERMRAAAAVTDDIFHDVLDQLEYGMSETDIKLEVEYQMLKHNTEGSSFVTGIMIRGGGADGELEGIDRAGQSELGPGRVLAFDFGVVLEGYVSDFGRTVYCGEPDEELYSIHNLVMSAQAEGIKALRAGEQTCEEVDRKARSVIEEAGYGPNFFHRLGHGIGIDVHEPPFLAHGNRTVVEENMCFTVEPSIWVKGKCFTRVEDVVVVTPDGGESLNSVTRDIIVI